MQHLWHFLLKHMRSFCDVKAPHNFSAKYISASDFVSTVRLKGRFLLF